MADLADLKKEKEKADDELKKIKENFQLITENAHEITDCISVAESKSRQMDVFFESDYAEDFMPRTTTGSMTATAANASTTSSDVLVAVSSCKESVSKLVPRVKAISEDYDSMYNVVGELSKSVVAEKPSEKEKYKDIITGGYSKTKESLFNQLDSLSKGVLIKSKIDGAMRTFNDESIQDRLTQAAHSMREAISIMLQEISDDSLIKEDPDYEPPSEQTEISQYQRAVFGMIGGLNNMPTEVDLLGNEIRGSYQNLCKDAHWRKNEKSSETELKHQLMIAQNIMDRILKIKK